MEEKNVMPNTDKISNEQSENNRLKIVLDQKQAEIDRLNKAIAKYTDTVNRLTLERDAANNANIEIRNSFYWRLMSPMRKFTQMLKNLIEVDKMRLSNVSLRNSLDYLALEWK